MSENLSFIPGTEPLFDPRYRFKVLAGGRGSGKSWSVARALLIMACNERKRILCCRELQNSIGESVHKLLASQIENLGIGDYFDIQRDGIYGRNGSEFIFKGIRNDPGKIKSMEGLDIGWLEEAENVSEESWDALEPTFRKPGSQIFVVYNPRLEDDFIHQLFAGSNPPPPRTWYLPLSYRDNPFFSEENRESMEAMKATNPIKYEWVWEGKCQQTTSDALWSWESINNNRTPIGTQPDFARIVVAVDPAVTANKNSDESGIIIAASTKGTPRHYYVLSDQSGRYQPEQWARKALQAYDTHEAGSLVFEVNQGGAMVTETVKAVCRADQRPVPSLKEVRASKGKAVRAEPIAALYSQGLVHHVGPLPDLERQLLRFDPHNANQKSPDRMDALVWALTELSSGRAPMKLAEGLVAKFTLRR